jgi:molybdopterin molybdotransferase
MKSIPDSLTPDQAWRRLSTFSPLDGKVLETPKALGYRLKQDVRIPEDVPAGDRSFMDGFAVRSEDVRTVPCSLNISGEVLMGVHPSERLNAHEAMPIPTGGFLPEGADAVVIQEDTEILQNSVRILKSVAPKENVQRRGEDFQKGDSLFPANHRLRAQDISALATFGIAEVSIIRKPVVAIVSTGNELVDFHEQPQAAQIRETNSLAISAATEQHGFATHRLGIIRDEADAQRAALAKALGLADVVLFSGGSSVGERDYTLEVIRSFEGYRIHFHGLAIRPGNPTIFASIGSQWAFGLPGQPVSSLVVFYHFVLPFLFHLSGEAIDYSRFSETHFRSVSANLEESIKPLKLKTDYVRLRLKKTTEGWNALPVAGKSSSLSTLAKADAFTIVPPGESVIEKGARITAFYFP